MCPTALTEFSSLHFFVEFPSVFCGCVTMLFLTLPPPVLEPDWFGLPKPVVVMATEQHPAPSSSPPFSLSSPVFPSAFVQRFVLLQAHVLVVVVHIQS